MLSWIGVALEHQNAVDYGLFIDVTALHLCSYDGQNVEAEAAEVEVKAVRQDRLRQSVCGQAQTFWRLDFHLLL